MSAEFRPQRAEAPTESDGVARSSEANALERLARLNESLRAQPIPVPPSIELPPREASRGRWRDFLPSGRIIKSILALLVAIALAWLPVQRLLATRSTQAAINARLVNLRAPIEGKVSVLVPTLAIGTLVAAGERLLQLSNTHADHRPLATLRRAVSDLRFEASALRSRLEQLKIIQADLGAQRDAFQRGRVHQLAARADELAADVKAAQAQQEDAVKSLKRSTDMSAKGHQTIATLLHAERDLKVANTKIETAQKRLESNKIELDGARNGLFIGDSYNDLPRSAQRFSEIAQQIGDLSSELEEREARSVYLGKELASEADIFAGQSTVDVSATTRGRIWEVLTSNGEHAQAGQDLLRVVDCSSAVVTATVRESVYNKLSIGQPAAFLPRDDSQARAGTVVSLTGLGAAGSNFAIDQTAITGDPYHVAVAVPGLATTDGCNVGRTGTVTFDTSTGSPGKGEALGALQRLKRSIGFP